MIKRATLVGVFIGLCSQAALAKPTAYLPLSVDMALNHDVDVLFAKVGKMTQSKPYAINDITRALKALPKSEAEFANKLTSALAPYLTNDAITSRYVTVQAANESFPVANQNGLDSKDTLAIGFNALYRPSDRVLIQAGGEYRVDAGNITPYNTMLSLGAWNVQLDAGYKAHWFSPFKAAAQVHSNNAKPSPSLSLSLIEPLDNWWGLNFEVFYTELDEVKNGVLYFGEFADGAPKVAGTHITFSPTNNWQIGLNRILQFGGGPRKVSMTDVIKAYIDPATNDNSYSQDERNTEFGDQIASITSSVTFDSPIPWQWYLEMAGEDTQGGSNYKLGNQAISTGFFVPELLDGVSVRYEYNRWKTAWYVNGNYKAGNTNDGRVFGHFAADWRNFGDAVPANVHNLMLTYNTAAAGFWQLGLTRIEQERATYEVGYAAELTHSNRYAGYPVQSTLTYGQSVFDDDYAKLAVRVFW